MPSQEICYNNNPLEREGAVPKEKKGGRKNDGREKLKLSFRKKHKYRKTSKKYATTDKTVS